jgi:hypothetical protein
LTALGDSFRHTARNTASSFTVSGLTARLTSAALAASSSAFLVLRA